MNVEIISTRDSSAEQPNSDSLNLLSGVVIQRNASDCANIRRKTIIRKRFYSCIKPQKMIGFGIVLFISLSITIAVLTVYLTSPKPSKTCQRNLKRTMKSSLISSSNPRSIALGDLNNDNQTDIVVANSGTHTIGIFISKNNRTFEKQKTYSTGFKSSPYSVTINDFNNDNYLDIAVANYGTNNIGIFLGNENGTFNDQTIFLLGSSRPLFVTTGDFNKDNRTDIAIVNHGTNSIGILFGYGDGNFQNQTTYFTGYDSHPLSLAVGDFNNDNYLDISVANYGTNNIGIFFGYGNGTFTSQQTYTTLSKSNPSSIVARDINNDGQLDIIVSNKGTGNVGIFLGHGNGTFQAQTTYSIDSKFYPQYIILGDLNQDNILDIVVADTQNNQVHILPGFGNGSFATVTTYDAIPGSSPICVAVADFDNNNQLDIVVTNYDTNNVLLLLNYFIEPSARQTNYGITDLYNTISVAVSDFNNDHILDVVYFTPGYIRLRLGLGNGKFDSEMKYSSGKKYAPPYICVGDVNNDNQTDIIAAFSISGDVAVVLGHGNGTFATLTTYPTGNGSNPRWVSLGDINNDHRLDIVSANPGVNTVGVFLGNGDGSFTTMVSYSTGIGSRPYSVAIGNLNNDNHLDFAVVNENDYVVIFLGYGDGTFVIWTIFPTTKISGSFTIALGDFNRDKNLDIVVANTFTDSIGVFLGYGDGTFGTQTLYLTGSTSRPYYVIVADFNHDNISDIVTTTNGNDRIVTFHGFGNGSFKLHGTYSTGHGSKPYGIVVADLDNNKQLDIVVALSGTRQIATLTEYYSAKFTDEKKYLTGSAPKPLSVAAGDLNNDNRSDIVVVNSGTDSLDILLGLNNGIFDRKIEYQLGTDFYPQDVIIYDIDKNNLLDLVIVNSKMHSIDVIMRNENETLTKKLTYSTADKSYPVAVDAGDFNNDNRIDLVIANEGTDSIGIFFGFNYTIFQNQQNYSSNDSLQPTSIDIGDFNNDNYVDIAATFYLSNKIGILLGRGNNTFATMMTYSTGNDSKPWKIVVNDFNNDGRLDIVVTNFGTNNVGIFLGYGNGNFTSMITYSTGENSSPRGVAVGDFNKDGHLDIVVANYGKNNVGVLFGYGNGRFSNVMIYSTGEGSGSWFVTVNDFNNDGNLDIAVANYGSHKVGILFGYSGGIFGHQMILSMTASARPTCLTVDDFNGDNLLDIVVADWNDNRIGIFIGYGNGSFSNMTTYSTNAGSTPIYVNAGDFNSDNKSDIAVASYGTNNIVVLFGLGDGSFLLGAAHSTGFGSQPFALAISDFNNDTRLDIVVANFAANNIGVFLAYDSQLFGGLKSYNMGDGSKPHSVAVNDLNKDGYVDIVVVNYGIHKLGILLGYGNGSFEPIIEYSTGNSSAPFSVAIADFDNDTHLDMVVANSQTNNILIFRGYGNGTFASGIYFTTGVLSSPYAITIGDFNNDYRLDIAIANYGTSNILLLYGYGDGTFGNNTLYPLGYGYHPYAITVIDVNQDNYMDIVVACYDTDHVETFVNMC